MKSEDPSPLSYSSASYLLIIRYPFLTDILPLSTFLIIVYPSFIDILSFLSISFILSTTTFLHHSFFSIFIIINMYFMEVFITIFITIVIVVYLDLWQRLRSLFNSLTISCMPGSFAAIGDRLSSISVFLASTSISSGTFASSLSIFFQSVFVMLLVYRCKYDRKSSTSTR